MALPKIHRLKRRQEFSSVYQSGLRRSTPHLTLRALRPKGAEPVADNACSPTRANVCPVRIGVSVSQKVSKRAVVRNRIKRQIRAAFRQLLPYLAAGWQLVVVVKPSATQCGYEQFLQELEQLLINTEVMDGH